MAQASWRRRHLPPAQLDYITLQFKQAFAGKTSPPGDQAKKTLTDSPFQRQGFTIVLPHKSAESKELREFCERRTL